MFEFSGLKSAPNSLNSKFSCFFRLFLLLNFFQVFSKIFDDFVRGGYADRKIVIVEFLVGNFSRRYLTPTNLGFEEDTEP